MDMLLQMDIDLVERLASTIQRFREDKKTSYSESSLQEAEKEIARIVDRMKDKCKDLQEYEKHIVGSTILRLQQHYDIHL